MLFLVATTDKLQLVTSAAATVDVHGSWTDLSGTTVTPGKTNTTITTATTTDIVAAPAASTTRNIKTMTVRNRHATLSCDMTVRFDQNGTFYELHKVTLLAGEMLEYVEGVGFFKIANPVALPLPTFTTADQLVSASVTNYLVGSDLRIPSGRPIKIGTIFRWLLHMSKTAAATASMTFDVRYGVNGTTADTTRANFASGTQTAAVDSARVVIQAMVRGPIGASCIVAHSFALEHNTAATGFAVIPNVVGHSVSAGFDVTTAGLIVGLSLTTSTGHAITFHQVNGEIQNI